MEPSALAGMLAPWFAAHHRDLSWRRTADPYAIWVSEIMLQQTRVETVERYYSAFLARFSTVAQLAAADTDEVLQHWSGLGYYRRARLLHRGAQYVDEHHGGELPQSAAELKKIPGVGPYTAGAIATIAFGRAEPLVDGNVARVLSRLHAIEDPAGQDARHPRHWERVRAILEAGDPRVLGQALMELGATVCTPRSPDCLACPVRGACRAHARGLEARIPAPRKKVDQPLSRHVGAVVYYRGKIALVRRPDPGLLAGLWCVPLVKIKGKKPGRPPLAALKKELGVDVQPMGSAGRSIRHVFTHRIWEVFPWVMRVCDKPRPQRGLQLVAPGQWPDGGVPSVTRKILGAAI